MPGARNAPTICISWASYWPEKVAPRHRGLCNVLYVDGSVGVRPPIEMDPAVPALNNELWNPTSNPRVPE